jgi:hypothetical protein
MRNYRQISVSGQQNQVPRDGNSRWCSDQEMGCFETKWLAAENLSALAAGQWIDRIHARRPPRGIVLDMDSSVGKMSLFFKC